MRQIYLAGLALSWLCAAFILVRLTSVSGWVAPREATAAQPAAGLPAPPSVGTSGQSRVGLLLELHDTPLAVLYAQLQQAAQDVTAADMAQIAQATQSQLALIEQAQQSVLEQLAPFDVQVLYRAQRVYNGIALYAPVEQAAQLAAIPGVKAVHRLVAKYPTNSTSVPYIGAVEMWQRVEGVTGAGITIAVIDTGVDYLHVNFGGPGSGYGNNDRDRVGDVIGFPGPKVIGGYDFTGDNYNADPDAGNYQPIPMPDGDPMDCYGAGHGTHVAGTAAGYGVTASGLTYTGTYTIGLDLSNMSIGPGVAPEAQIYALKVFGCSGSSEIVDQAIEWAVDPNADGDLSDHVDIINLSLGSAYGAIDDPTTIASENAAQVGVIVVASAGNSGDTYFTVGSPGVASSAISVAASIEDPFGAQANALDRLASFSARGPRRHDGALKPDIAAPGQNIFSARAGSGSSGYSSSGTSMAAPHVAGAMALLRQYYPVQDVGGEQDRPDWSAADLKALVMNTAHFPIYVEADPSSAIYGLGRVGAGRIDLTRAMRSNIIAYSAERPGEVSLSFGMPEVLGTTMQIQNLRIANKGSTTITLAISLTHVITMPGVNFAIPITSGAPPTSTHGTVVVPPDGFVTLPVSMTADAAKMERTRDRTVSAVQNFPRHWLSEAAALIWLTPLEFGPQLHVPVYAAPRPASQLRVAATTLDFGTAPQVSQVITLAGQDLRGTRFPTDVISLAGFFALQWESPNQPPAHGSEQINSYDHADLKYVGISSNYAVQQVAGADAAPTFYIAIVTYEPWSSPNEVQFDIYLDTDLDGRSDYRLYNSDQTGYLADNGYSDAFVTVLENLFHGGKNSQEFLNGYAASVVDTAVYGTNVMVLPLRAQAIGLDTENPLFDYYIESYSRDVPNGVELGLYIERSPVFRYNMARPGLLVTGGVFSAAQGSAPIYDALSGANFTLHFDLVGFAAAKAKGLLILHLHNLNGQRAQILPITYTWPRTLYLPTVPGP